MKDGVQLQPQNEEVLRNLCCNTLQHSAAHCNTLQHAAAHCNTLHHAAAHCNTLQHAAAHCNTVQIQSQEVLRELWELQQWERADEMQLQLQLQHTATRCNTNNMVLEEQPRKKVDEMEVMYISYALYIYIYI